MTVCPKIKECEVELTKDMYEYRCNFYPAGCMYSDVEPPKKSPSEWKKRE